MRRWVLFLSLVAACSTEPLEGELPTPRDGGPPRVERPHDGSIDDFDDPSRDGGVADAGVPRDAGPTRDGGFPRDATVDRDAGCGAGTPWVATDPVAVVIFHEATTDLVVTYQNGGAGSLWLESVDIRPDAMTPAGEFSLPGCATMPCPLDVVLCPNETFELPVRYLNSDGTTTDYADLVVKTNVQDEPQHTLQLQAIRANCAPPPTAIIEVTTATPAVGQVVTANALLSLPGGPPGTQITAWNWVWAFGPTPLPTIVGQGTSSVNFTPTRDGTYFLGLEVQSDCFLWSPTPATQMIHVSQ